MDSLFPDLRARDAAAGASGALCLTAAGLPFDRAKILMQVGAARSPLAAVASIVRSEGPLALWRGFGPALASALVENIVVFATFNSIKRFVAPSVEREAALTVREHAVIGGLSGCFSATAICTCSE